MACIRAPVRMQEHRWWCSQAEGLRLCRRMTAGALLPEETLRARDLETVRVLEVRTRPAGLKAREPIYLSDLHFQIEAVV